MQCSLWLAPQKFRFVQQLLPLICCSLILLPLIYPIIALSHSFSFSLSLYLLFLPPYLLLNSPFSSLNTVREVCTRCPLAMNADLLQDLAGYKSYRDKSVVMAARSLVQLFRSVRPELLSRKDRVGKQSNCVTNNQKVMNGATHKLRLESNWAYTVSHST